MTINLGRWDVSGGDMSENVLFTLPSTGRNKMAENNPTLKPLRLTETVKGAG
jgi:hypothetical protein